MFRNPCVEGQPWNHDPHDIEQSGGGAWRVVGTGQLFIMLRPLVLSANIFDCLGIFMTFTSLFM